MCAEYFEMMENIKAKRKKKKTTENMQGEHKRTLSE
jgi:hypothetical protein